MGAWKQSIPQQVLLIAKSMVEAHLDACRWRRAEHLESPHTLVYKYICTNTYTDDIQLENLQESKI